MDKRTTKDTGAELAAATADYIKATDAAREHEEAEPTRARYTAQWDTWDEKLAQLRSDRMAARAARIAALRAHEDLELEEAQASARKRLR